MALRSGSLWWPMKALVFGILAIVLSFVAYNKRIQEKDVENTDGVCIYFGTRASSIAISAAIALFIEQINISVAMSFFCCGEERCSTKCSSIVSIIVYIFSWFSFVIAMSGLIYTSVLNRGSYLAKHYSNNTNGGPCFIGNQNVMLGAAFWCIITVISSFISYAFWEFSGRNNNNNYEQETFNYQQGVAMGHPHSQLPKQQYGV